MPGTLMATFVGVDWGSTGWVCVSYDGTDEWDAEVHPSFLNVWHRYEDADHILVDIPIGLVEEGLRECDEQAESELDGRRNSVFYTPPRPVFECESYPEAKEKYEELTGRGMTTQAWSIMPRIRELDVFFAEFPEAHGTSSGNVRESHPEVCFKHLNEGDVAQSKLADGGIDERLEILEGYSEGISESYRELEARNIDDLDPHERRFSTNHRDDLVDAMGLAVSASVANGEFDTLPEDPPEDGCRDVPIEIVCADPQSVGR